MPFLFDGDSVRSKDLHCPRCGQAGHVTWDNLPAGNSNDLVRIEGDFFERMSRKAPYPIELVCNGCGTVQPGSP
jgi:hypothetical protein